jgi:photosystem II stability/assembly factor-like uncharacterized protein
MASRPYLSPQYRIAVLLVTCWMVSFSPSKEQSTRAVNREARTEYFEQEGNGRFEPNEQFFYDRNYPDSNFHFEAFQRRLEASMAYDESNPHSRRGLESLWTIQGPGNLGGRVNTIAVKPDDPQVILIGYSQGGIFRTEDGGQNWVPVFDKQASLSISDIQFDPNDAQHVWATTGDVNILGYYFIGAGVYESKNSGRTWKYRGLKDVGILSKIAIDNNPNYIYVGSMGYPSQKGLERGIYRSTNGGNSWEKTLYIDDSTGIIDIVADRTKSGRVFASSFTRLRSNTLGSTLCPGTSLYRSDDFGATWSNVKNGLPEGPHSRTSIEITNSGILFISYSGKIKRDTCPEFNEEIKNIYKSTDAGLSWDTIPTSAQFRFPCKSRGGIGWYFDAISVNPDDPNDIFLLGLNLYRTKNGGFEWNRAANDDVHEDQHVLLYAHGQVFLGTDGGAYRADINGTSVFQDMENISATQFYRTTFNPNAPGKYYGGAQDNGTSGGNESTFNSWSRLLGADGFQPLFDPLEPEWIFALQQNGAVFYKEESDGYFMDLMFGLQGDRYWDMPFIMSPFNSKILYCGSSQVYKLNMNDASREWKPMTPDLTKGKLMSGNRYPALTAIAQSPIDELRMYVGTQDGLVWTTADGGQNWTNISEGTPGAFVTSISCSIVDPQGVFITHSGFRDEDHHAYIYYSNDAGAHWETIGANVPMMGVNNIFIMPGSNDKILIVGTDGGVYVSFDAGDQWDRVGSNMPYFPVYDIDFNPVTNQIVAATFARGIMTFPLDELELETAVDQPPSQIDISVYPIITSDFVNIEILNQQIFKKKILVSLLDVNGNKQDETLLTLTTHQKFEFRNQLPGGLYYIVIQSGELSIVRPIVIQ